MMEIDAPNQGAPNIWFRRALLLPVMIGGFCLAGIGMGADLLLFSALAPFQSDMSDTWRTFWLYIGRIGWQFCVILICISLARSVIRRLEGGDSGILSDSSLFTAMAIDHSIFIWAMIVLMVCDLSGWAIFVLLDVGEVPTYHWLVPVLLCWTALRLAGLAVERMDPALWSAIKIRTTSTIAWPGPIKLMFLASLAALTLFVNVLPKLI